MTHATKIKAPISLMLTAGLFAIGLAACKAPPETQNTPVQADATQPLLPPIRKTLSCLPHNAAIIAAHRGTDEHWKNEAENSIGGLKALIKHGTLMAEIDVAGLKDDTLITFHDGVWDEISTKTGPIATSTKKDLNNILLKSRSGELTADRPPLFEDMLDVAKGKLYMEVDFKSSADPKAVIKAIRDAGMSDQVLLIAYNASQAAQLKRLAPEMLRSNPTDATQADHAVWLGYDVADGNTANSLKEQSNYIIGRIGDPKRQPPLADLRKAAHILVTDRAAQYGGIIGLNDNNRERYENCLAQN